MGNSLIRQYLTLNKGRIGEVGLVLMCTNTTAEAILNKKIKNKYGFEAIAFIFFL
jgi:hypothetical protein